MELYIMVGVIIIAAFMVAALAVIITWKETKIEELETTIKTLRTFINNVLEETE